jgi:phosphotransferase system HPr (HPr) family protein
MIEKSIKVRLSDGLEFGPATMFVQVASKYKSRIYVLLDNKKVNAKSIMGMLTLGMVEGENVIITADGEDEAEAIAEIEQFLSE